ncbi:hypothetical protein BCR35DRAFT_304839 [Leucosporidium creatinivorum]|uniref:Uncharacterized protein n=1 Tax=Leucosporidium creatinivorum TaxID=106004 RepID=A0A1Y2F5T6_9BASI|nr:hypothetical protein BCR35DRAFT_304839 [Leucosporidium creatinivorum]
MASPSSSRFEELPPSPSSSSTASFHSSSDPPLPPPSQAAPTARINPDKDDQGAETDEDDPNDDSVWWTPSELRDILDRASALKAQGNAEFGRGQWELAMATYRDGLVELPVRTQPGGGASAKGKAVEGAEVKDEEPKEENVLQELDALKLDASEKEVQETESEEAEMKELNELRSILFANVAACYIKLERWKEAVQACDDALEDNPHYIKALQRRALANESIGSWSSLTSALEDLKTLEVLPDLPSHLRSTIRTTKPRLEKAVAEAQAREQAEVMGKLKDLGNTVLGKFGLSTDNFKFVEQPGGGYSMNFER